MSADYSIIRDHIEKVIPGFENFNQRIQNGNEFYLPNNAKDLDFSIIGGRAKFKSHPLTKFTVEEKEYILMTIRSHDQFNTTIYGLNDRYRGIFNERRIVFMNKDDMKARDLKEQDVVNLKSEFNCSARVAKNFKVISYDIPKNCCATYFPETNVLVPLDSFAHTAKTPASKSVIITIEKV